MCASRGRTIRPLPRSIGEVECGPEISAYTRAIMDAEAFAYLYTDRPVYRPGQEVFFKGIVRQNDDLHYSIPKEKKVYVTIELFGERVFSEDMALSKLGSFNGKFNSRMTRGLARTTFKFAESAGKDPFGYLSFRVAEYHKPEFEVLLRRQAMSFQGSRSNSVYAKYYSGGTGERRNRMVHRNCPLFLPPRFRILAIQFHRLGSGYLVAAGVR